MKIPGTDIHVYLDLKKNETATPPITTFPTGGHELFHLSRLTVTTGKREVHRPRQPLPSTPQNIDPSSMKKALEEVRDAEARVADAERILRHTAATFKHQQQVTSSVEKMLGYDRKNPRQVNGLAPRLGRKLSATREESAEKLNVPEKLLVLNKARDELKTKREELQRLLPQAENEAGPSRTNS